MGMTMTGTAGDSTHLAIPTKDLWLPTARILLIVTTIVRRIPTETNTSISENNYTVMVEISVPVGIEANCTSSCLHAHGPFS